MKIAAWNINGLRAALPKGLMAWVAEEQPDVLCLQEVRARPEQVESKYLGMLAEIYSHNLWNPADRPGYSGVTTFARQQPLEVSTGLGSPEFDNEGRVICSRFPGFLLYNIYFPNGGRDLERVPYKLAFYARLLEICDQLHASGERVILCGDFNTCHRPIDLKNARSNEKHTGFLPEEREWIDHYLAHGFVDIYRWLYPDRVQYTWWAQFANARINNVGWRLDFFLVSEALVACVKDTVIHDAVTGSDHCPVSLFIDA